MKRPNVSKADDDFVRNRLKGRDLESAISGMEVNDAWKKFNGIMREIMDENTPTHKWTNKRRPWVTREVKKRERPRSLEEISQAESGSKE